MNILEDHTVRSLQDIKSNYRQIQLLNNFLNDSDMSNFCMISGSSCTAKSSILSVISKYSDYDVLLIDRESNHNSVLQNFVRKKSICSMLFAKKRLILVDDVHMFDKAFVTSLKDASKEEGIKIIVTVLSKDESKVQDLKQSKKINVLFIKLNRITFQDCFILVNDLIEQLGLGDTISCETVVKCVKDHKHNVRKILQSLSDINLDNPGQDNSLRNFNDMNIYELSDFFVKNRIDETFLSLNITGVILYIIYENSANLFEAKKQLNGPSGRNCTDLNGILSNLIDANMDAANYENSFLKNVFDYSSSMSVNKILLSNAKNDCNLKFTTIFNKLSIKSSFSKKVHEYCDQYKFIKPFEHAMIYKDSNNFIFKKMSTDFL